MGDVKLGRAVKDAEVFRVATGIKEMREAVEAGYGHHEVYFTMEAGRVASGEMPTLQRTTVREFLELLRTLPPDTPMADVPARKALRADTSLYVINDEQERTVLGLLR